MQGKRRQRTTLSLNPILYRQAQKIATIDRRDVSTVMELALEAYFRAWKAKRREEAPMTVDLTAGPEVNISQSATDL